MRRKILIYILICVVAGVMFTGCGSNEEKKENASSNVESTLVDNTNNNESSDQPSQNVDAGNTEQIENTTQIADSDQPNKAEGADTTENAGTTEKNEQTTEPNTSNKAENEKPSKDTESSDQPTEDKTPADKTQAVHKHNYTSNITKAATCTETGVKTYTCSCGDSYTENIAKTSHTSSDWIVTKAATCQSTGIKVKTCTACNNKLETAIIEKSSDHAYVWTHVTNGDYKVNICSGCGSESGTRAYNLGNNIYGYYDTAAATELFGWVNEQRNAGHTVIRDEVTLEVIGLTKIPSLIWRDEDIAKKRALDIVSNFSHDGYLTDNENLAKGHGTAVETYEAWCYSSTHRQTMCAIDYVYGSTACLWIDSDGKGTMYPYWTLVLSIE